MAYLSRQSDRHISALLLGLLCLWGGFTLVRESVQVGPGGQVVRQSKSDRTYTTSFGRTLGEGLLLGAGGAIGVIYGLRRLRVR